MKGLTERQREVLTFIESFIATHHFSPSYVEIRKHFGFSSLGSVYKHIQVLKRKGHLDAEAHCSRSLAPAKETIQEAQETGVKLPFIGQISLGSPIETFLKWQDVAIPPHLVRDPGNSYLIQINGDEMASDHLVDGDLLIVEAADMAEEGDTVLAVLHDEESVIRRFFPEGIYARLEGRNPEVAPIVLPAEEVAIQGIVVGMIRSFQRQ